jgi:hypothetical protein
MTRSAAGLKVILLHRLGPGEESDIGIAGAIHDDLCPHLRQPLLGGHHNPGHPPTVQAVVDYLGVHEVPAGDLVQGVDHRHLEIVHVALKFVLPDADGLVAVGADTANDQIVDGRATPAPGKHLVDGHAQTEGTDFAEEGVTFQQECRSPAAGGGQGGPDAGRAAAYHQDISIAQMLHSDPPSPSGRGWRGTPAAWRAFRSSEGPENPLVQARRRDYDHKSR